MADTTIDLYFWTTPNGYKIPIMLEECGLPYRVHGVDIGKGDQFKPEFLAISPNNRIPAIVDPDGPGGKPISVFESGAILQYLGRKTGVAYPQDERARVEVDEWLFWQVGGLGPMLGQANHFRLYAKEKVPYGIERYTTEAARLYGVLDRRLAGREYICGDFSNCRHRQLSLGTQLQEPRAGYRELSQCRGLDRAHGSAARREARLGGEGDIGGRGASCPGWPGFDPAVAPFQRLNSRQKFNRAAWLVKRFS